MFLTLANEQVGDRSTASHNLEQLVRDALFGDFPKATLGWNPHEYLRRLDPAEYPRNSTQAIPTDDGTKILGYVADELPRFQHITPIGIVHWLAERGDEDALAALDLPEPDSLRRIAERVLPGEGSWGRLFIESLTITIAEARRFFSRHNLPVPESLRESPIKWSVDIPRDGITVADLPYMPITEIAQRWSLELGDRGLGVAAILRTIWRAFWHGELALTEGLLVPAESRKIEESLERFTRAKFLWAIDHISTLPSELEQPPELGADERCSEATDNDYKMVADRWGDVVNAMEKVGQREVYVDVAMVEREPFNSWCISAKRAVPAFWARSVRQRSTTSKGQRGRPPGVGSLATADDPLVEEMRSLIASNPTLSPWAAAMRLVARAAGGGGVESKAKRLVKRYSAKLSKNRA